MRKTLFILTVLALGFTACNKEAETPQEQPGTVAGSQPVVYGVSIPANLGVDTKAVTEVDAGGGKKKLESTFRTTDNITVFNKY